MKLDIPMEKASEILRRNYVYSFIVLENRQTVSVNFVEVILNAMWEKKKPTNKKQLNWKWTNDENIIVKSFDTERENEKKKNLIIDEVNNERGWKGR